MRGNAATDDARDYGPLTQRQAENIADLAARRSTERMYAELGRSVVRKAIWALGAGVVFVYGWLKNWIHFGPQ